jgi:fucose permease
MKNRAYPIFFAFLCMGFADAVGPFVGLAKNTFQLSNFMAQLIVFMGLIMFGVLSIPLGILQARTGKKTILQLGLAIALLGLAIPTIFGLTTYPAFLLTILLLGAGATALQVSGNPIMRDVSPEGKYSRNLAFSQSIKSIGSLSGPVIPAIAAYYFSKDWRVVLPIYAFFVLITLMMVTSMKVKEEKSVSVSLGSCFSLLKNKFVFVMVMSIFLYVGAEVCISSGIPVYMKNQFGVDIKTIGVLGTGIFFLALTAGRFLGALILNWLKPAQFFIITAILSILGILLLFTANQTMANVGVVLIGLGFANIFPLIFSMAVDAMPEKANELSGLMVTAIVGGAFIPPLMGILADKTSSLFGFIVPLAAITIITIAVALNTRKLKA